MILTAAMEINYELIGYAFNLKCFAACFPDRKWFTLTGYIL